MSLEGIAFFLGECGEWERVSDARLFSKNV